MGKSVLVQLSKLSKSFAKVMKLKFCQNYEVEFCSRKSSEMAHAIILWAGRLSCMWLPAVVMQLLWGCYAPAMQLLCSCYAVAMRLLWGCYAIAMRLLCFCYEVAMRFLCCWYAVAMQLLCCCDWSLQNQP